jgi:UDP-N-acetylglucosamine--N-acetylmuramyl-(pentapeptide) pyrophosphoryl-undecaprenol N-acetylglucosamine transferase
MRLLIAAGGTGGHIYPALAVARSLRARPDAADLAWLGGHRGLEAGIVPAAGIPFHRLALRSLRSVDMNVHAVLDPVRLGASVPQAAAMLVAQRPAAIFTTGGYVAVPVLLAAAPLGIPGAVEAPGSRCPRDRLPGRRRDRVVSATWRRRGCGAGPSMQPDGHPDP